MPMHSTLIKQAVLNTAQGLVKLKLKLWLSALFLIIAALIVPGLALNEFLMPASETINIWFQRSGSLVVIFAAISEMFAFTVSNKLQASGTWDDPAHELQKKHGAFVNILKIAGLTVMMLGTFIWGYGDIFL